MSAPPDPDPDVQRKVTPFMNRFPAALIGLLVGLALGFALVFGGFDGFVIVAVFMIVGFLVGKVVDGELDVLSYLGGGRRRDR